VLTIFLFGEHATGNLLVLSQVVLSLQLSFAVIPLVHLVSDRRWMGQYVVKPLTILAAWAVAAVIAGLNLKLAVDEISAWLLESGSLAWLLWFTVVPVSLGLVGLLAYVTVVPVVRRHRGGPTPLHEGVHGPVTLPAVDPPRSPRRIAVAVDFSTADGAVLSHAVSVARSAGRGVEVVLLHVVESGGARLLGDELGDREAHSDQERLEVYTTELTELGVETSFDLGFGDPVAGLVELVERHRPDLVVLGSHGHRGVADFVHGTSVERLRHRIQVPVLVVPTSREPG